MIKPKDQQICVVKLRDGTQEYAVWTTSYSIYGAGGHFQFADGSMLGIPVDVEKWWGTCWLAVETDGIAVSGQLDDRKLKAYTDYPITELGDKAGVEAPIRECFILDYDHDKYCKIEVNGVIKETKSGYIYRDEKRYSYSHDELVKLFP